MNAQLYIDGVLHDMPIDGFMETISPSEWSITLYCAPSPTT